MTVYACGIVGVGAVSSATAVPRAAALAIIALLALLLAVDLLRGLDFDWPLVGILLAGLTLWVGYLRATDSFQRGYDVYDHLMYVGFVEQKLRLPPAVYCTICHHPPLYYLVGALWVHLATMTRILPYGQSLQLLSLVIWFAFVVFSVSILKRYLDRRFALYLAAAMVTFWPYGVMNSARVGNDGLAAALTAAALYFTIRWFEEHRRSALDWAALLCGLGLLTKSSAYVGVVLLVALMVWRSWRMGPHRPSPQRAAVLLFFLGGCALVGASNKLQSEPTTWCEAVLGRACDVVKVPRQLAANGFINYLYFDIRSFLSEPFINTYRRETGPDYFWNSLLKSSLFGTYSGPGNPFPGPTTWVLALGINAFLLAIVVYTLIGLTRVTREHLRRYRVLLLFSLASLGLLAGFRAILPLAHHADFRFVLPLLAPGCLFFALTVNRFGRQSRALAGIGYGLGIGFVLLTVALFSLDVVFAGRPAG